MRTNHAYRWTIIRTNEKPTSQGEFATLLKPPGARESAHPSTVELISTNLLWHLDVSVVADVCLGLWPTWPRVVRELPH